MSQIVKIRNDAKKQKWLSNFLLITPIIIQNSSERTDSLSSEAHFWVKSGAAENRDGYKPCKRKQDLHSRLPLRN